MTTSDHDRSRLKAAITARSATRRAVIDIARDEGVLPIARPAARDPQVTVEDLEPLDGMRATRKVELAARSMARRYVRAAREAGHDWQEIGEALELSPNGEADPAGNTVAEAAYS